jgi:hypothetical protein
VDVRGGRVERGLAVRVAVGGTSGVNSGATGVTATTVGTYCSYRTPGEGSASGRAVTTGIGVVVGVGLGTGGAVRATAVTPGGAGAPGGTTGAAAGATGVEVGAGSAGMKASVGTGTGVAMRATVCRVDRQVGRSRTAAPAIKANPKSRFKRAESYRRAFSSRHLTSPSTSTAR